MRFGPRHQLCRNRDASTTGGARAYNGASNSVTFTNPFPIREDASRVRVNSGQITTGTSSYSAVFADNGHFYDVSATYSKPGIKDTIGVRSSYFSGLSNGLISNATWGADRGTTGSFGCLTDRFDGFLVTTYLGARTSLQSASNYNGTFDRINQWVGIRVTAPVKQEKSNTTVNQQTYANIAFGSAIRVKIKKPAVPPGATGSNSNVSPDNYIGLQVNATSGLRLRSTPAAGSQSAMLCGWCPVSPLRQTHSTAPSGSTATGNCPTISAEPGCISRCSEDEIGLRTYTVHLAPNLKMRPAGFRRAYFSG